MRPGGDGVRCSVIGLRCFVAYAQRLASVALGIGACTRIRTRDQLIKSQLLYQLSYAGAPAILSSHSWPACSATFVDHPPFAINPRAVRRAARAAALVRSPG